MWVPEPYQILLYKYSHHKRMIQGYRYIGLVYLILQCICITDCFTTSHQDTLNLPDPLGNAVSP